VRVIDGEFTATLQSDIKPQQVRIRAAIDKIQKQSLNVPRELGDIKNPTFPQQTDNSWIEKVTTVPLEAYTQVEFTTYLRPSLVTGVLNLRIGPGGTNYWGSLQEFLNPDEIDKGTTVDFMVLPLPQEKLEIGYLQGHSIAIALSIKTVKATIACLVVCSSVNNPIPFTAIVPPLPPPRLRLTASTLV